MSDPPEQPNADMASALAWTLTVLAVLTVMGGAVASLMLLVYAEDAGNADSSRVLLSVGCLLSGVAVGSLLWAGGHLVRRRERTSLLAASAQRAIERRESQAAALAAFEESPVPVEPPAEPLLAPLPLASPVPTATPDDCGELDPLLREILAQLKELNENVLLTAEQRQAKRRDEHSRRGRQFAEEISSAIDAGDFRLALQSLEAFRRELPERADEQDRLGERIVQTRDAEKLAEIEARQHEVRDLMAVSSFDRAEALAAELAAKYPDRSEVTELLEHVHREGAVFLGERRDRLYRNIERLAEARQWRPALQAARKFVDAFPDGVNADAIRAMMPTIEDNARIEEVREIRDHIRDLIERRRYAEALEAAEEILRRFPGTRAAEELTRQLGRLRELARGPSGTDGFRR